MANPLLNLNKGLNLGNIPSMIEQFNQFKNTFTGDPQKQVQSLIESGKMSQEQFNQLSQMAKQIEAFIPKT